MANPTIVLIHGAFGDGSSWRPVFDRLVGDGHTVLAPPNPLRGLPYDASYTASVIDQLDGPVVLVGHSYGGMVITGAAARAHARISRLVYLDGFVPEDGQSFFDLLLPARRKAYEEATSGGVVVPPEPEVFGVVGDRAAWVSDRLTAHPLASLTEPLAVPAFPPLARQYVRCTQGPLTPSFSGFAVRLRDTAGWDVVDFDAPHDAMVTHPTDLAALLAVG